MNDLISRQAAIAKVNEYASIWMEYTEGMSKDEIAQAALDSAKQTMIRILSELPSAQPEQRWIPCSERLPEVYEAGNSVSGMFVQSRPVLVYGVPEYESEHGFHVVTYCDDLNGITYWSTELDAVTINEVIAWMPLPEPYEERREE